MRTDRDHLPAARQRELDEVVRVLFAKFMRQGFEKALPRRRGVDPQLAEVRADHRCSRGGYDGASVWMISRPRERVRWLRRPLMSSPPSGVGINSSALADDRWALG
ncbi:hypothetical protein [Sphingobium yanoikuyae]|uniref:hypothetical protein n=1 Tax=Sphingobium yanoikuyae TaxID=13690 RepID=UPI0030B88C7C